MNTNGFWIDNIHSAIDWDLVMSDWDTGSPKPKTEKIAIPGADGDEDMSTVLTYGDIKFQNRTVKIDCSLVCYKGEVREKFTKIMEIVHGQIHQVKFDEDPDFYYLGRCTVSEPKVINNRVAEFTISVDAKPYKLKIFPTVKTDVITGSKVVFYQNLRKWVVPTFKTDAEVLIEFGNLSVSIGAGEHLIPDIMFMPGENVIKYTGNATVTVTYQEGAI